MDQGFEASQDRAAKGNGLRLCNLVAHLENSRLDAGQRQIPLLLGDDLCGFFGGGLTLRMEPGRSNLASHLVQKCRAVPFSLPSDCMFLAGSEEGGCLPHEPGSLRPK